MEWTSRQIKFITLLSGQMYENYVCKTDINFLRTYTLITVPRSNHLQTNCLHGLPM